MRKKYRIIKWLLLLSILACVCCGCNNKGFTETGQDGLVMAVSMETTPVINYTVPSMKPNILVNRKGYSGRGNKEAVMKGRELPGQFRLVDAESGEVVYRGFIEEKSYDEGGGYCIGLAVFTDFTREGRYYLECDGIGRSLTFSIQEDIYQQLFLEIYQDMISDLREQKAAVLDVSALLTVYEWYPDIFPDENGDEIPDILDEIARWIEQREKTEHKGDEDTIYVAVLAKFSYLYQKFDVRFATECLQYASALFTKVQTPMGKDADNFYALTELYRATGLRTYRSQIADYAVYFEDNTSFLEEISYLYGAMTYMATRQTVDVALCNTFMDTLMSRGEDISKDYTEMIHPLSGKTNGADELLKRVRELSCCNYILNNYQYTGIMEEFLHYLMGENVESICFYPEEGEKSGYLFLLAQLTATAEKR